MDRLKAMATFVRIVDSGSLAAAAEATERSPASVVRTLAALERHLGVRLLNRNTRRLALTDEGTEFLAWSRRILAEFDEIEHRFDARRDQPGGRLRITAPVELGRRHVAPVINGFLRRHPAVQVELLLVDDVIDLLDEGLDLAVRVGALPDSAMVAVPLGRTRPVVCASPRYLDGAGLPLTPAALAGHRCIAFLPQGRAWRFRDGGANGSRRIAESIVADLGTNQVQAALDACVDGLGVARLLHYQVADDLAAGRLVRLLADFEVDDLPIQIVYPHARLLPPRVRLLIDWIAPRLRAALPDPAAVPITVSPGSDGNTGANIGGGAGPKARAG